MNNLKEGMDEIRNFLSSVKPRQAVVGIETIKEMCDEISICQWY